jgi:progesterone-induced-blocking factor 1
MANRQEAQCRKIDLLAQDKEYLTKENIQLIEKNRRLEDKSKDWTDLNKNS